MQKFTSIGKKALFAILIVSTLVTTIFTIVSFAMDYNNEMDSLSQSLNLIESTSSEPLSKALWDFNEEQVKHLLDGIIKVNDFLQAEIYSADKTKLLYNSQKKEYDLLKNKSIISREYKLSFERENKSEVVGILKVTVTKSGIFSRLFKKALLFFLLQGLKTACVSFLILWIFRKLILTHIEEIHQYLKASTKDNISFSNLLQLKRAPQVNDEFTSLTQIINDMAKIIREHQASLTMQLDETNINLEEQKERSMQSAKMASLGEMAGGISHEINNPLTIIAGKLNILRKKNQLGPISQIELGEHIELMYKTSERIAKIVKGLKTFARDGAKDPAIDCSLKQIMMDSLVICEEKIKNHGILLHVKEVDHFHIQARAVEISQVIVNLISNSIDAIDELDEKWIKIETSFKDNFVELRFIDSGKGIPKEIASKMMEPFFTTKEVNKGTGLGLSISKGIIDSHGGKIFIDQTKPNTTFVIQIPGYRLENVS